MEHLLSLEVVTARIDGSCANEADRMAAESALRHVVKARNLFGGIAPVVNIRWVDRQITSTEESKTVGEDQPADNGYPTAKNEVSGRRIIESSSLPGRSFTCHNPGMKLHERVPMTPWETVLVLSESCFSMFSGPETGFTSTPAIFIARGAILNNSLEILYNGQHINF